MSTYSARPRGSKPTSPTIPSKFLGFKRNGTDFENTGWGFAGGGGAAAAAAGAAAAGAAAGGAAGLFSAWRRTELRLTGAGAWKATAEEQRRARASLRNMVVFLGEL
jgi:hypothetical protein